MLVLFPQVKHIFDNSCKTCISIWLSLLSKLCSFLVSKPNSLACLSPSLLSLWISLSPRAGKEDSGTVQSEIASEDEGACRQESTTTTTRRMSRRTRAPAGWLLSRRRTWTNGSGWGVCWNHPRSLWTESGTEGGMCPSSMTLQSICLIRYFLFVLQATSWMMSLN